MVVLTVPVIAPLVVSLGYDPSGLEFLIVLICETGILTPPVGMMCFVVQGIRNSGKVSDVFIGVIPFIACLAIMFVLMLAFPDMVLWLPKMAFQ